MLSWARERHPVGPVWGTRTHPCTFRQCALFISFTLFAAVIPGASAQTARTLAVQSPGPSAANLPVHRIAANDLIALSVYDAPELTRTVRVGEDGKLDLPLLKQQIDATGLLPTELAAAISTELKAEQILVRPIVTVTIMEYNNRSVSVMGAVHKPLTFPVIGATRLLDALARAEGTTSDAGPELLLSKEGSDEVLRISLKQLVSGTDPATNVILEGGEQVRIPEALKIYVVGNVKKPGAFPVRDASETTVLKILALVEGVSQYAQDKAFIYRADPTSGARQEIAIELKKILGRKSPDVVLKAEDILYVPDNINRRRAMETGKSLLTFGSGAISAAVYAGVH